MRAVLSRDWLQCDDDVNDNNDADRRSTETAHSSDVSVSDLAIRDLHDSATDDSADQIHRHSTDQAQGKPMNLYSASYSSLSLSSDVARV